MDAFETISKSLRVEYTCNEQLYKNIYRFYKPALEIIYEEESDESFAE